MKKHLAIGAGIFALLLVSFIISLKLFFKPMVESALHAAGFPKAQIESADFGFFGSASTLKNIKLDDAGTTIGEVTFTSTIDELKQHKSNLVVVSDVKLNWPLILPASKSRRPLNLLMKYGEFKNVTVTVPTAMGPVPLQLHGEVEDSDTAYKFKTAFLVKDGTTTAIGKVVGVLGKTTRRTLMNIELKKGDITLPDAQLVDMSGFVTADVDPEQAIPSLKGKLDMRGAKIYGVPMENNSLIIKPDTDNGADRTLVTLLGNVMDNSGKVSLNLTVDHADKDVDKLALNVEASVKDLAALDVADMGGKGNIVGAATGEHTKGKDWGDLSQWKNLTGSLGLDLQKLSLPGLMKDAEAIGTFKMDLDPATHLLSLRATDGDMRFQGKLSTVGNRELIIGIPLNTERPPTLQWDSQNKIMTVDFLGGTVSGLGFIGKKVDATLNVTLDDYPSANGTLGIGELKQMTDPPHWYFIPVKVDVALTADKSGTKFNGTVSEHNGRLSAKITGSHDEKLGKGFVSVRMPPTAFAQGVQQVANVFPFTQFYFTDAFGTAGLSADFGWQRDAKGKWVTQNKGQLYLKDLSATIRDNALTGISTVLNLDSLSPPVVKQQQVAVGAVNVGLPLTDGLVTVSLDKDRVFTLHDANWSAVGGKISSSPFAMKLADLSTNFTLTAKQLDLQQLFAIAPLEGLTADGKVDGVLPIHAENGRFSVENGVLNTTTAGTIKYNPQNPPAFLADTTNKQIIDLKAALTQFNYESLGLTINGELGKSQQLGMKIKGKNPLFYGGKPVNFNLNVEGPIENIIKYNPGSSSIPDSIRKLMETYEAANAKK